MSDATSTFRALTDKSLHSWLKILISKIFFFFYMSFYIFLLSARLSLTYQSLFSQFLHISPALLMSSIANGWGHQLEFAILSDQSSKGEQQHKNKPHSSLPYMYNGHINLLMCIFTYNWGEAPPQFKLHLPVLACLPRWSTLIIRFRSNAVSNNNI